MRRSAAEPAVYVTHQSREAGASSAVTMRCPIVYFSVPPMLSERPGWRNIPIVVLTAKDVSGEERRRLSGYVETILQKSGDSREKLLHRVRDLLDDCAVPRAAKVPEPKLEHVMAS